jgi:hypothetical protein
MTAMVGYARSTAWLVLAAMLAWRSGATAADAGTEAQKRFEEGKRLYRHDHDVEGARAKFAQAYALAPRPEILWNLAVCELDLGRAEEAVRHLRTYSRDPEAREGLTARLPELVARARASLGALRITAPREAVVRLDGHVIDARDWRDGPLDLAPGDRVLVVELRGERFEDIVTVRRGETAERRFPDAPITTAADAPPDAPSSAAAGLPAAPARTAPAGGAPGAVRAADRTWPLVLAGLGLAGAGAGVAFSLASQRDADDASRARVDAAGLDCRVDGAPPCAALRDALDAGRTHAWLAVGSYAAAALLIGGAGWLALRGGALTAQATPTGLSVRGAF